MFNKIDKKLVKNENFGHPPVLLRDIVLEGDDDSGDDDSEDEDPGDDDSWDNDSGYEYSPGDDSSDGNFEMTE